MLNLSPIEAVRYQSCDHFSSTLCNVRVETESLSKPINKGIETETSRKVVKFAPLFKHRAMKMFVGHAAAPLRHTRVNGQLRCPADLPPGKEVPNGQVDPRAGLNSMQLSRP